MNDLRGHDDPIQPNSMGKIIAVFLVGSAVAIVGIYGYETGALKASPRQIVRSQDLPACAITKVCAHHSPAKC